MLENNPPWIGWERTWLGTGHGKGVRDLAANPGKAAALAQTPNGSVCWLTSEGSNGFA